MEAGMGVDWGDYDGDSLDITVTNFQAEPNQLYHNEGNVFLNRDVHIGNGNDYPTVFGVRHPVYRL